MAVRRAPIRLTPIDVSQLSESIRRSAEAAGSLQNALAMLDATWEPHDWSDFD